MMAASIAKKQVILLVNALKTKKVPNKNVNSIIAQNMKIRISIRDMIDLVIPTKTETIMIVIVIKEIMIEKESGKDLIEKKEIDVNTNIEDQENLLPNFLDHDLIADNTVIDVIKVLNHVQTAMSAIDMNIARDGIMKEGLKKEIDIGMIIVIEEEIALTPARTLILVHVLLVDDMDTKKLNYLWLKMVSLER